MKKKTKRKLTAVSKKVPEKIAPRRVRTFFAELGPGLITGAADDDPSGISTYSVTGASFGYAPL
jgi:Mn2+/Fe2+ NRAMP family transporter